MAEAAVGAPVEAAELATQWEALQLQQHHAEQLLQRQAALLERAGNGAKPAAGEVGAADAAREALRSQRAAVDECIAVVARQRVELTRAKGHVQAQAQQLASSAELAESLVQGVRVGRTADAAARRRVVSRLDAQRAKLEEAHACVEQLRAKTAESPLAVSDELVDRVRRQAAALDELATAANGQRETLMAQGATLARHEAAEQRLLEQLEQHETDAQLNLAAQQQLVTQASTEAAGLRAQLDKLRRAWAREREGRAAGPQTAAPQETAREPPAAGQSLTELRTELASERARRREIVAAATGVAVSTVTAEFTESGPLGLKLNETEAGDAEVVALNTGTQAARIAQLSVGLVLESVGGQALIGVAYVEVLQMLRRSGRPVTITFLPPSSPGHSEQIQQLEAKRAEADEAGQQHEEHLGHVRSELAAAHSAELRGAAEETKRLSAQLSAASGDVRMAHAAHAAEREQMQRAHTQAIAAVSSQLSAAEQQLTQSDSESFQEMTRTRQDLKYSEAREAALQTKLRDTVHSMGALSALNSEIAENGSTALRSAAEEHRLQSEALAHASAREAAAVQREEQEVARLNSVVLGLRAEHQTAEQAVRAELVAAQQQLASAETQLAALPAQQSMQAEAHEQAKQKAVAEESAPLLNQISQLEAELAAAQAQAEAAAHSQAMAEAKAAASEAQASEAESVAQRKWVDEVAGLAKSEAAELADARAAASLADSARQEAEHEAERGRAELQAQLAAARATEHAQVQQRAEQLSEAQAVYAQEVHEMEARHKAELAAAVERATLVAKELAQERSQDAAAEALSEQLAAVQAERDAMNRRLEAQIKEREGEKRSAETRLAAEESRSAALLEALQQVQQPSAPSSPAPLSPEERRTETPVSSRTHSASSEPVTVATQAAVAVEEGEPPVSNRSSSSPGRWGVPGNGSSPVAAAVAELAQGVPPTASLKAMRERMLTLQEEAVRQPAHPPICMRLRSP